jgi:hypothetical protein
MIIEIDIYPADEPWLSLGYTRDQVSSNIKFPSLKDSKIHISDTLAQLDEFFFTSPSPESS